MKRINYAIVFRFVGVLLILCSLFMFLCLPVGYWYQEESLQHLLVSAVFTLLVGGVLFFTTRNAEKNIKKREGYLIVAMGWLSMVLFGALPYYISGHFLPEAVLAGNDLSFTNALFESTSGFTTTGATILTNIEAMPKSILFWRSLTHWIGGMGIIVLTIAILPILGIGGMQLFVAEAPGISANKLHPRITETAKRLWYIYLFLTLLMSLFLWLAGMNYFDAINHALSTLSTGGFSTKNASVAYWNNRPLIQYIIILFMFIAGTNFVLNYFMLKGQFKKVFKNNEFRVYSAVVFTVTIVTTMAVYFFVEPSHSSIVHYALEPNGIGGERHSMEGSLRHSLFQVLAILTTTGFVSADFSQWLPVLSVIFFALMFVGGSAGSTSGGIKIVRHLILIKSSYTEFKRLLHPNAIIPVKYNGKMVKPEIIQNVLAFFMIYMLIFIFGSVIMSLLDGGLTPDYNSFISSIGVTASSLGNVGPAFGKYSPVDSYAGMTVAAKWFASFLMLLGRLELFTLLILMTPFFWRNN